MDKVALDLGFIQIYWYSICIMIGLLVGMFLVYKESYKKGISENTMTNLIFYTVISAIIGARLYYVIFKWDNFSKDILKIFELWNGGLAIHGAIILGGLCLILYTKKRKLDTLKVLDICAVGLIIGQAIGRWGNFFNQEAYGGVVSLDFLKGLHLPQFIIDNMYIKSDFDGIFAYRHPTFLYESLWCLIGFIVLLIIRRRKYIKTGQIFGLYCIWYGIGRFFIEGLRMDSLMFSSLKMAQIVSIGMILVGIFFVIRRLRSGRFEYLYNEAELNLNTSHVSLSTKTIPQRKKLFSFKKKNKKKEEITATPIMEMKNQQEDIIPHGNNQADTQTEVPKEAEQINPQVSVLNSQLTQQEAQVNNLPQDINQLGIQSQVMNQTQPMVETQTPNLSPQFVQPEAQIDIVPQDINQLGMQPMIANQFDIPVQQTMQFGTQPEMTLQNSNKFGTQISEQEQAQFSQQLQKPLNNAVEQSVYDSQQSQIGVQSEIPNQLGQQIQQQTQNQEQTHGRFL